MTSWRRLREQIACSAGQLTLSFGGEDVNINKPEAARTTDRKKLPFF